LRRVLAEDKPKSQARDLDNEVRLEGVALNEHVPHKDAELNFRSLNALNRAHGPKLCVMALYERQRF
jgi:hypothetical protein